MVALRSRIKSPLKTGFTLVELSIVLVIIGLIIGGVLVGRDLISAATVRAQISQIEKYNAAVNTFRGKYGYLPGDIPDPTATQYGFTARGSLQGQGDGNGILEGNYNNNNNSGAVGNLQDAGETPMFWVDLSIAGLIGGGFNTASAFTLPVANIPGSAIPSWFPSAKIGGNYVFVFSYNNTNYYQIEPITGLGAVGAGSGAVTLGQRTMTSQQAYVIDTKIDDGLPASGTVIVRYVDTGVSSPNLAFPPVRALTGACYNNNQQAGVPYFYSLGNMEPGNTETAGACSISIQMR